MQVTNFDFQDGVVSIECAEAVVGGISLAFQDAQSQPVEKPRTRKEVIVRHITTKPGARRAGLRRCLRGRCLLELSTVYVLCVLSPSPGTTSRAGAVQGRRASLRCA